MRRSIWLGLTLLGIALLGPASTSKGQSPGWQWTGPYYRPPSAAGGAGYYYYALTYNYGPGYYPPSYTYTPGYTFAPSYSPAPSYYTSRYYPPRSSPRRWWSPRDRAGVGAQGTGGRTSPLEMEALGGW